MNERLRGRGQALAKASIGVLVDNQIVDHRRLWDRSYKTVAGILTNSLILEKQ
jgi:hypothetical protein